MHTERIRNQEIRSRIVSAENAAGLIMDGMTVGVSGFTTVGYPKAVPMALAEQVKNGRKLQVDIISGASTGAELDGALAEAGAIRRRYPYQSNKTLRERINDGSIRYVDMHLGELPWWIRHGYMGRIDIAVIEAAAITEDGSIVPTTSVGCSDVLVQAAESVIVEINTCIPEYIEGIHDIYTPQNIPFTEPIPIRRPGDRIGSCAIPCSPDKIRAVVFCDIPDHNAELAEADEDMHKIAQHLIGFLKEEMKAGRLPDPLPPLQSGVGGVANAVLGQLRTSGLEQLTVYTEVMQDAVIDLIESGQVITASATALTISPSRKAEVLERLEEWKGRIILRPQEISNSPEVIRRLGVIAMNTAIEADLSGNVNSTHIGGTRIMNGIGGSGDYARNAALTIFSTASTAKRGSLSCIVPRVSHVDHTEHDVDVLITEQGLADLRGLTAYERAEKIIRCCAHPAFRPELEAYLDKARQADLARHGLPNPEEL